MECCCQPGGHSLEASRQGSSGPRTNSRRRGRGSGRLARVAAQALVGHHPGRFELDAAEQAPHLGTDSICQESCGRASARLPSLSIALARSMPGCCASLKLRFARSSKASGLSAFTSCTSTQRYTKWRPIKLESKFISIPSAAEGRTSVHASTGWMSMESSRRLWCSLTDLCGTFPQN
jgi:hypothetical protein